jgi:hypothetical protein
MVPAPDEEVTVLRVWANDRRIVEYERRAFFEDPFIESLVVDVGSDHPAAR